jgi:hypothetical protein
MGLTLGPYCEKKKIQDAGNSETLQERRLTLWPRWFQ